MRATIFFCIELDTEEELSSLIEFLKAQQIDFHTDAVLPPADALQAWSNPLSCAEKRLLQSLLSYDTISEAAQVLYISPHTARKHLENIYRKLGVRSLHRALAIALRLGYITAEPSHPENDA